MAGVSERPAVTPDGLVIRQADEADLGRVVELLLLGSGPRRAAGHEDPADLGPYRARCVRSTRVTAPSWWPSWTARWSGSAS